MDKFSHWIDAHATSRVVIITTVIFLFFIILVLPAENKRAAVEMGSSSPDLSLIYSPDDLISIAKAYGVEGRAAYVLARIRFDIVWPLAYGVFLCTGISWLLQRILLAGSRWQLLNLLPILAVGFDFLENLFASIVMMGYPDVPRWAAIGASMATPLKWFFVVGCFTLAAGLMVAFGIKKSTKKELRQM